MDKLVMKRNSLSSIVAQITVCYLMVESFVVASAGEHCKFVSAIYLNHNSFAITH